MHQFPMHFICLPRTFCWLGLYVCIAFAFVILFYWRREPLARLKGREKDNIKKIIYLFLHFRGSRLLLRVFIQFLGNANSSLQIIRREKETDRGRERERVKRILNQFIGMYTNNDTLIWITIKLGFQLRFVALFIPVMTLLCSIFMSNKGECFVMEDHAWSTATATTTTPRSIGLCWKCRIRSHGVRILLALL